MSWIALDDWRSASPDPIAPHAAAILDHMNRDHADGHDVAELRETPAAHGSRC